MGPLPILARAMVVTGPLSREIEPELWSYLTKADKEWLELMCDVLPAHWPVNGTQRGLIYGIDPALLVDTVEY